jgi:CHAT domain-containing protein
MVLSPAADLLGKKRLLIVSDGALQYISFGALPAPVNSQSPVVSGKRSRSSGRNQRRAAQELGYENEPIMVPQHLILDHEIVNLPSASVLVALRREHRTRARADASVAVVADPVFSKDDVRLVVRSDITRTNDSGSVTTLAQQGALERSARDAGIANFQRLRFSREEAVAIASLLPADRALTALDFTASRETVTELDLSRYRIVHFATHGLLNTRHPELSGLVLSLIDERGQPQDGFLRLHEVYSLKLDADLVVLSGCETALGKEMRGEGLIGLTRGFMYAGSQRVVASLWRVDDRATAELMKRFYQGMLKQRLTPAAALRAAQISLLKERRWSAPHYWAAFTIQGEWR